MIARSQNRGKGVNGGTRLSEGDLQAETTSGGEGWDAEGGCGPALIVPGGRYRGDPMLLCIDSAKLPFFYSLTVKKV